MRTGNRMSLFLFSFMWMLAYGWVVSGCGGGGGTTDPEPAGLVLDASAVTWDAGELRCTVTARVTDAAGAALAGVEVGLEASRADPVIAPSTGLSDEGGEVVFVVNTTRGGRVDFQGRLVTADRDLGSPVQVQFGLTLDLQASEPVRTFPGARAEVIATVADGEGPVVGVELALESLRSEDVVSPASQASDSQGRAVFEWTTRQCGEAEVALIVAGLDLEDSPRLTLVVDSPEISGTWRHEQPDATLVAPRVGLIWLDMHVDPTHGVPARELTSVAVDPVPRLGDSGGFSLGLPLDPPEEDFYRPDPDSPDLPATFVIAPYGIGIYDDLDLSGDLSVGDALVAVPARDAILTCARGELPDESQAPGVVTGYQYLDSLRGDPPLITSLEDLEGAHELVIRMAPCPSGTLAGEVGVAAGSPDDLALRAGVLMVHAGLFLEGATTELLDHDNFIEIASTPVAYQTGAKVDYSLSLPHPATAGGSYRDLLVSSRGLPSLGLLVIVLYVDTDADGAFTNDDDDPATGDLVAGFAALPFGVGKVYLEWVDTPIPPMLGFAHPGLNQGYNIVREPLKVRVEEVIDDTTLRLHGPVEGGHEGLSFRIQRPAGLGAEELMAGDDLSTGVGATSRLVTSGRGGFSTVVDPATDVLVFTDQLERLEYVDLDLPVDLGNL